MNKQNSLTTGMLANRPMAKQRTSGINGECDSCPREVEKSFFGKKVLTIAEGSQPELSRIDLKYFSKEPRIFLVQFFNFSAPKWYKSPRNPDNSPFPIQAITKVSRRASHLSVKPFLAAEYAESA